jgi:hypothetical protein
MCVMVDVADARLDAPRRGAPLRAAWFAATFGLSVAAFAVTIVLAPEGDEEPLRALGWLLFTGSAVHVAATAWLYTVPEIRAHVRSHPRRYVTVPVALVVGSAAVAAVLTPDAFVWLLLPFFAWQFFHFQKQNLGMAALAAAGFHAGSLRPGERRAIVAAGCAGTAGLLLRPELLELDVDHRLGLLFPVAGLVFAATVAVGVVAVLGRPAEARPWQFLAVYATSLLFFAPVFVFDSPYRAVAGIVLAHGYQYLVILALLAGARTVAGSRVVGPALLLNIALLGGLALATASHLHDGSAGARALYGAYLGVTMAHFVIDAGIWRLRDEFPRRFLTSRLPYLLARPAP